MKISCRTGEEKWRTGEDKWRAGEDNLEDR